MRFTLLIIFLLIFFQACTFDKTEPEIPFVPTLCDSLDVTFSQKINPIIQNNCSNAGCHDSNANGTWGDFTSYVGIKEKIDNGSFRNRVLVQKNMPPSGGLTAAELQEIECWLNDAAPNN